MQCTDCGAVYSAEEDSCAVRFSALLALDHSRQEPWGTRHGHAFAAYALQHPKTLGPSLDRAWTALYRIYVLGDAATFVFGEILADREAPASVPPRPTRPGTLPAVTIADLADFDAKTYPERLDAWCRAALAMWGASVGATTARRARRKRRDSFPPDR